MIVIIKVIMTIVKQKSTATSGEHPVRKGQGNSSLQLLQNSFKYSRSPKIP